MHIHYVIIMMPILAYNLMQYQHDMYHTEAGDDVPLAVKLTAY